MLSLAVLLLSFTSGVAGPGPSPSAVAPEALEMARVLGLDGNAEALREGRPVSVGERARVLRRVLQASFEVEGAIADVQEEQAALAELSSAIQSDRDARVGVLNVAAGLFAAGAAVGTGMTLRSDTATAGTWITTVRAPSARC